MHEREGRVDVIGGLIVSGMPAEDRSNARTAADPSHLQKSVVAPGMPLHDIAKLSDLNERALALTFTRIDRQDPLAWQLIQSVNVPVTGEVGRALQARLYPPPKKRQARPRRSSSTNAGIGRPTLFADLAESSAEQSSGSSLTQTLHKDTKANGSPEAS